MQHVILWDRYIQRGVHGKEGWGNWGASLAKADQDETSAHVLQLMRKRCQGTMSICTNHRGQQILQIDEPLGSGMVMTPGYKNRGHMGSFQYSPIRQSPTRRRYRRPRATMKVDI